MKNVKIRIMHLICLAMDGSLSQVKNTTYWLYLVVATQARVVCLICYIRSPRAEGVHIRQTTHACTAVMLVT